MAAYCWIDDLQSPAGWLPVHRDQLRAQRSVTSMRSLYLFLTLTLHTDTQTTGRMNQTITTHGRLKTKRKKLHYRCQMFSISYITGSMATGIQPLWDRRRCPLLPHRRNLFPRYDGGKYSSATVAVGRYSIFYDAHTGKKREVTDHWVACANKRVLSRKWAGVETK